MHDNLIWQYLAEVNFILEIIMLCLLAVNYYFAISKDFKNHRLIVRYMVLGQTILSGSMLFSLLFQTEYGPKYLPHAIFGTIIYSLIVYTFLLMEKKLPEFLRLPKKHHKVLMQLTNVLWGIAILTGVFSLLIIT